MISFGRVSFLLWYTKINVLNKELFADLIYIRNNNKKVFFYVQQDINFEFLSFYFTWSLSDVAENKSK